MNGTEQGKNRLRQETTEGAVASEDSAASPPVSQNDDMEDAQIKDSIDQDPEEVPNRIAAPPPPTTEEAGVKDNR